MGTDAGESGTLLLTVFLKHDQSQTMDELQRKLADRQWWDRFPPEGCEVVSWNVAMGLGQIVTLRLAPDRLAAVNVEVERSAWGVFTTEFYASYDFVPVRERIKARYHTGEWSGGTPLARGR